MFDINIFIEGIINGFVLFANICAEAWINCPLIIKILLSLVVLLKLISVNE